MMKNQLLKASIGVTIVMVIGNLLSFVKEASIANFFGISADVDAYTIAIQIPVLIFSFISVAIQSVVIPIYSDIWYNKTKKEASAYLNNLITLLLIITSILAVIGIVFSGPIVYLFAPGFAPDTHALSASLLRITFPSIIFSVVCQVLVAVLNVHKQFVANSFAIYFTNVTIILCVIFLYKKLGIAAACIGQLLGDGFRCTYVILLAGRFYKYRIGYNFKDQEVLKTLKSSLPVIWGISVAEVNAIVNRIVGSFLFAGSISAISYANKVNTIFLQLSVAAIATIVYPLYAESTAKNDLEQLNNRVNQTISAYSFLLIPISFGMIVFRKEVVEIVFGRGAFDQDAILLTQSLLGIYAVAMLFMGFRSTLTNVFYSMKDTKTPAINASIGAILNVILNLTLPFCFGVQGLAMASSITAIFITVSLIRLLSKKYDVLNLSFLFTNIKPLVLSGLIMFVVILLYHYFAVKMGLGSFWVLLLGTLLGIIVYFVCVYIFKVPIAIKMMNMIKK